MSLIFILAPVQAATPPGATTAIAIVALICAYNFYRGSRTPLPVAPGTESRSLPRPPSGFGWSLLCWQLVSVAYLAFEYHRGGWTAASVRLAAPVPAPVAFVFGCILYAPALFLLTATLKRAGLYEAAEETNLRLMARFWPREPAQKAFAVLAIGGLNPFTEELLFRGILVAQMAAVTHAWPVAIAAGLIATVANHAYQGKLPLTTHVPMYFLAVLMLASPLGLPAAIGFHFAADLAPILTLRRDARRYFATRRAGAPVPV